MDKKPLSAEQWIEQVYERSDDLLSYTEVIDKYAQYYHAELSKWISVSERLPVCQPKKLCHCLVIAPRSFPKNCEVVVAEFYDDNNTFYSESGDYPMEDVTHWMYVPELPSPPKQQQHG